MPAKKEKSRVDEAVDAINRHQDAADRRYKYSTSVLGFLNDYAMSPTYDLMVKKAKEDMDAKARIAEFVGGKEELMRNLEDKLSKSGTKKLRKGGSVGSASKRADGCAMKGKTKGRMI